ncbi:hypothetical protein [Clostridium sp.]|uniref:YczE/YyaS/YitT family protein n=1 Tax=Clostridium sp. TaxID=1506 RepID=UPI00283ABD79|nr:hypothetical protein [Clostridium sp.]MDR3593540.1 hypothetical protein [Clostridium sp.]
MNNIVNKLKKKSYVNFLMNIAIALVGVAFVGFGIAFNSAAMLGNDAVAILYDGVRNVCGFELSKLGIITNVVNYSVIIVALILNRKYINIGTFIYTIPMGNFVSIGSKIHDYMNFPNILEWRILSSVLGCSMTFLGIGIFIAVNIGFDPFTSIHMIVRDRINSQFKTARVICDIISVSVGFLLGGKLGIVTVVAALVGGPSIQFVSEFFKKSVLIHVGSDKSNILEY